MTLGSILYVVSTWEKRNAKDKGNPRVSTPPLRDMSTVRFKRSSDPLLRERLWLRVCADIYSRRFEVPHVLEASNVVYLQLVLAAKVWPLSLLRLLLARLINYY